MMFNPINPLLAALQVTLDDLPTPEEQAIYEQWSKEDQERFFAKPGTFTTTSSIFEDLAKDKQ